MILPVRSFPHRRARRACGARRPGAERGIALIAVLWLTVLLTVIASSFAFSMRSEALAARNALSLAQARAAADGAVERTAFELQRPRNLPDVVARRRRAARLAGWRGGVVGGGGRRVC